MYHSEEMHTLHIGASRGQRKVEDGRFRIVSIAVAFGLCYLFLAVRLIDVTFADRSVRELVGIAVDSVTAASGDTMAGVRMMSGGTSSDTYNQLQSSVPAMVLPRQSVRDRNGELLASSVSTRSLYARPKEISDSNAVLQQIKRIIPDLNDQQLMRRLNSDAKFVWLKRHLTPKEQSQLLWEGIPGLYFHEDYRRIYPHGRLFSHILGYTDVDGNGLSGVEKYFNRTLLRDDRLTPLNISLDVRIQHSLHRSLEESMHHFRAIAAAGAVLHVPTGQLVALASFPDFDPNRPLESHANARFNRMSVGQYELGSIFKALSTAMALEHGHFNMRDGFDATHPIRFKGNTIRDFHAKKRWLSIPEIMVYSSNIGTVKMVHAIGQDTQREFLQDLGMFSEVGIELKERSVPVTHSSWKPIESATISYGHGIQVTPLHLVRAITAVIAGGEMRDLTLVKDTVKDTRHVVSADVSQQMNRMMRAVVQHGTAKMANVTGYNVGAKTGTANKVVDGRYNHEKRISSIVAAFPMQQPEYLIFAMLDEPRGTKETFNYATAGWVAAPVAAQIIADIARLEGMPPIYDMPEDDVDRMIVKAAERAKAKRNYVHRTSY